MYNQFLIDHFDSYRITNQKSALTQCHPLEYSEKNVSYYSLFLIDSLNILKLVNISISNILSIYHFVNLKINNIVKIEICVSSLKYLFLHNIYFYSILISTLY